MDGGGGQGAQGSDWLLPPQTPGLCGGHRWALAVCRLARTKASLILLGYKEGGRGVLPGGVVMRGRCEGWGSLQGQSLSEGQLEEGGPLPVTPCARLRKPEPGQGQGPGAGGPADPHGGQQHEGHPEMGEGYPGASGARVPILSTAPLSVGRVSRKPGPRTGASAQETTALRCGVQTRVMAPP